MPIAPRPSSVVDSIVSSGSHTRDSRRSSLGWESRPDGQLYKRDYFQLSAPTMAHTNSERGLHILGNVFTGTYALTANDTWMREKNIERVLVLGTRSGVSVPDTMKLRVVDIMEGPLDSYFDSIVTLITESCNDNANVLIVDRDNRTFNAAIIVAYLLSLGWTMDSAVRRIEGIFRTSISSYQMSCLRQWDQTLKLRRTEISSTDARRRSLSVPALPPPATHSASFSSVVGSTVPAISAVSVINPAYRNVTTHTEVVSTLAPPAISAVSVVNPYWTTGPLISAQSVINPYWNTIVAAPVVAAAPLIAAAPVVQPVIHPVIHATIPAGPLISAQSVINPYWNECVTTTSVANPVFAHRHSHTEVNERFTTPTSWHSRSVPAVSSGYHFSSDSVANPLSRHPLALEAPAANSGSLFEAVETTARNRAFSLQRQHNDRSSFAALPEYHMVREVNSMG